MSDLATQVPYLSTITLIGSTALGSFLLTWAARWLAPQIGWVDRPDRTRKFHPHPIPVLGGLAFFLTFTAGVNLANHFQLSWCPLRLGSVNYGWLMTSATLICWLGLVDDRWPLRARDKFVLQVLACAPYCFFGKALEEVSFLGETWELGLAGNLVALVWIITCTNVINLIDGLDGLASSIGLIATLTLGLLALCFGRYEVAGMAALMGASLFGFLIHNWPPARIYLGDSGSLTVGFLVGALSIEGALKTATGLTLTAPAMLLAVPLFDTVMAVIRRRSQGRHIADPDHEHIHHRLQQHGLSKSQTLVAIGMMSVTVAGGVVVSIVMQRDWIAYAGCVLVFGFLITSRLFGDQETSHLLFVTRRMLDQLGGLVRSWLPVDVQESLGGPEALWQRLTKTAQQMGASRLTLSVVRFGQVADVLKSWESQPGKESKPVWLFQWRSESSHGHALQIVATGEFHPRNATALADLSHLSERICVEWPLNTSQGPAPGRVRHAA